MSSRSVCLGACALSLALAAATSLGACSDDTEVSSSVDAGGADSAAAADALATPPREDSSVPPSQPVACGADMCSAARYEGVVDLPACCTSKGACGLDASTD